MAGLSARSVIVCALSLAITGGAQCLLLSYTADRLRRTGEAGQLPSCRAIILLAFPLFSFPHLLYTILGASNTKCSCVTTGGYHIYLSLGHEYFKMLLIINSAVLTMRHMHQLTPHKQPSNSIFTVLTVLIYNRVMGHCSSINNTVACIN